MALHCHYPRQKALCYLRRNEVCFLCKPSFQYFSETDHAQGIIALNVWKHYQQEVMSMITVSFKQGDIEVRDIVTNLQLHHILFQFDHLRQNDQIDLLKYIKQRQETKEAQ